MQKNGTKFIKILQQPSKIKNFDKFLDEIKKLEEKRVYIQAIPCKYIIDLEHIEVAAQLAIKDFELGINKAKKVSTEFLLRFTGKSQIREAIEEFFQNKEENFIIVAFADSDEAEWGDVIKMLEYYRIPLEKCEKNLKAIMDKFNISKNEIKAVKRPRENEETAMKKILLERIALSIFM